MKINLLIRKGADFVVNAERRALFLLPGKRDNTAGEVFPCHFPDKLGKASYVRAFAATKVDDALPLNRGHELQKSRMWRLTFFVTTQFVSLQSLLFIDGEL